MARNAHPEVTRQRILDAARTLFARQGYERTSIQDIINELGDLSKGAIYRHSLRTYRSRYRTGQRHPTA